MKDPRIQIVHNEKEHGYTKNFENAINHSRGDIIFLSDQDDVWKENKVKVMCEALKDHKLAIHDAVMTDGDLNVTAPSHFQKYGVKKGFWHTFVYSRYSGCCMAMTREFLKRALPFPEKQKYCPYDYWLPYLGEFYHEAIVLDEALIYYRRHEGTALFAGDHSTRTFWEKFYTKIYCLKELLKRRKI